MGKRSNFPRRERDYYPTPRKAVLPLIPHLPDSFLYIEPCAGNGSLVDHLADFGGRAIVKADIEPQRIDIRGRDAMDLQHASGADFIITNPPWSRDILHPMIKHFSAMCPTWLLFDADWAHTKQAARFMPWLCKIVSVGRVKWIPDSEHSGKDNCAWYLFDQRSDTPCEFIGRAA